MGTTTQVGCMPSDQSHSHWAHNLPAPLTTSSLWPPPWGRGPQARSFLLEWQRMARKRQGWPGRGKLEKLLPSARPPSSPHLLPPGDMLQEQEKPGWVRGQGRHS